MTKTTSYLHTAPPGQALPSRSGRLLALAACLGLFIGAAQGATLINLDATGQPLGPLDPWPNTGTVAGDFNAAFTPWVYTSPQVITVDGVKGVAFENAQAVNPGTTGTAYEGPIVPDFICGGANRTIEAWVWDPSGQDEKTIVAWGHRGGNPDGSNCTFGHSAHPVWGCLGGWGYADLAYSNTVVFSRWTYIVYTYDSASRTAKSYTDGVLGATEVYATQPLVTWTNDANGFPIPFRVARQTLANGTPGGEGVGTNVVARIRVRDVAMTAAEILAQFDAEKAEFNLVDSDGDQIPDWWEVRYGFNKNDPADAAQDPDSDSLNNLGEYQRSTLPNNPDTDADGLQDGVETGTGTWVSATNTGTNPLDADTDDDGLLDGVETNTGVFVSATNTGSNPFLTDTDADSWGDAVEVRAGSNPNNANSIPAPASWAAAVTLSNPKYWYRFEETDPLQPAANSGSATAFQGAYGAGIVAANLGQASALPSLGRAIEFTGPAAPNTTTKYVDMAASVPPEITTPNIPELVNLRGSGVDKTTTVEYWFKTTQVGTHGNNSWQSPSIIARESPGDGDMYWGKINNLGEFGFSTSDLNDILTRRDMNKNVTDGQWHHLVMIKEWHVNQPCRSTMYIDGGPLQPNGASFTTTTAAGNPSYQDADSIIRYIGFTQNGELENVQYIGFLDEVVIYDHALSPAEVRMHSQAVFGADTDSDGMPDVFEINNQFNPSNPADAPLDADSDGLTNLQEYQRGTNPRNPDTDADGLADGAETGTGTWVSPTNTGTDPLNPDTDLDRLADGVENNTGTYVDPQHTGTSPLKRDSDNDGFADADEIELATDPTSATSHPQPAATWAAAVQGDNPIHWLRFEETTTAAGAANLGSASPTYAVFFGPGILDADLGKESAHTNLGKALEFTGPAANNLTTKYVDFGQAIPELVNFREGTEMVEGKEATVEYWFKTTIRGSNGNNTWQNPSILARESGGDGDMYWGNFNQAGDFIFSTSDLHDAHITNGYATDGTWHHVVVSKIWHTNTPSISRLYMDGGASFGGKTIETTTDPGPASGQDNDGALQYLGFTQNGGLENVQYIGLLDEVAFYTNAFNEAKAQLHFVAGGGVRPAPSVTLQYQKVGSDLILIWPTGVLEAANEVNGQYSAVPGASSPHTNAITGERKFFRVLVE